MVAHGCAMCLKMYRRGAMPVSSGVQARGIKSSDMVGEFVLCGATESSLLSQPTVVASSWHKNTNISQDLFTWLRTGWQESKHQKKEKVVAGVKKKSQVLVSTRKLVGWGGGGISTQTSSYYIWYSNRSI